MRGITVLVIARKKNRVGNTMFDPCMTLHLEIQCVHFQNGKSMRNPSIKVASACSRQTNFKCILFVLEYFQSYFDLSIKIRSKQRKGPFLLKYLKLH